MKYFSCEDERFFVSLEILFSGTKKVEPVNGTPLFPLYFRCFRLLSWFENIED